MIWMSIDRIDCIYRVKLGLVYLVSIFLAVRICQVDRFSVHNHYFIVLCNYSGNYVCFSIMVVNYDVVVKLYFNQYFRSFLHLPS